MFKRVLGQLKSAVHQVTTDEVTKPEPLLSDAYFAPRREYTAAEITPEVIIHNHLATQDLRLDMLGHGLNRMYEEIGELKGVVGLLKRLVVGICVSGATALILDRVFPHILPHLAG